MYFSFLLMKSENYAKITIFLLAKKMTKKKVKMTLFWIFYPLSEVILLRNGQKVIFH